ncbi:MAG: lipopolysaccharide biosynthesis protein [Balneolaceae bacterium]
MGIVAKQSLFNTFISYAGILLGFVLTIFLFPYILDPDQYGLTRVLLSASLIGVQFASLGVRNSVIRFFPFFESVTDKQHGLLLWAIVVPAVGFLLFSLLYWLFSDPIISFYADQSPLFVEYYFWVLPLTLFVLYFDIFNSYLRSLKDSVSGSVVQEIVQRLVTMALLGIYFFEWLSFPAFLTLFVLSYAAQPALVFARIWQRGEVRFRPSRRIMRKRVVAGLSSFTLYSLLGGIATVLVWNVDILMLGSMAGLANTAIYAVAFYIGSVITVPQRAIDKIASPLISEKIKKKQWDQVHSIYKKTALHQLLFGLFVFGAIWINIDLFFLALPQQYGAGIWVVFIIGIGKLIDISTGANSDILLHSRYYRFIFYSNLLLVVLTISLNALLIPQFGIEGAAFATATALFTYNTLKVVYLWRVLHMLPFTAAYAAILVIGVASILLTEALPVPGFLPLSVVLKNLTFGALFITPVFWFNLSPDLRQLLMQIGQKLVSWKKE